MLSGLGFVRMAHQGTDNNLELIEDSDNETNSLNSASISCSETASRTGLLKAAESGVTEKQLKAQ